MRSFSTYGKLTLRILISLYLSLSTLILTGFTESLCAEKETSCCCCPDQISHRMPANSECGCEIREAPPVDAITPEMTLKKNVIPVTGIAYNYNYTTLFTSETILCNSFFDIGRQKDICVLNSNLRI